MQTRTVQVRHLSDLATEREIHEFFSFSGEIELVQICRDLEQKKTAFVTFKDPRALEIALLLSFQQKLLGYDFEIFYTPGKDNKAADALSRIDNQELFAISGPSAKWLDAIRHYYVTSDTGTVGKLRQGRRGATIVDQIVRISPVENYVPKPEFREVREVDNAVSMSSENPSPYAEGNSTSPRSGKVYISKAQDVVSSVLAKGSAIRQDAVNKAKAFDEKHQLRANASARVNSLDKRVGITEKFNVGVSVVNEKVKSVDQKLQVSDKTMAALMAAERKLNNTGSAVKSSRYVTAGTAWLNGAFGKVAKAGQVAGTKTRQKWNLAVSNLTAKDSPIAA